MAILTIARKYGSGGREIGQAIAEQLAYEYIDRKRILDDMKAEGGQWEERAKLFDENYPNIRRRYDWSFRGFVALNQSYFLQYALKDHVVIIGRGGNFLLKGVPYVLRVRIIAPMEKRTEKVMEQEGVNREMARMLIDRADREMAGMIHLIYGRDWDNTAEYDLVFNTGDQSAEEIVLTIKNSLREREVYDTEKTKKVLALRVLSARIKAAIATEPKFSISVLDVIPKEEGLVEQGILFRGIVHQEEDIEQIKEVASRMAGEVPVEYQLHYRWYPRIGQLQFK